MKILKKKMKILKKKIKNFDKIDRKFGGYCSKVDNNSKNARQIDLIIFNF